MEDGNESTSLARQVKDGSGETRPIPKQHAGRAALATRLLVGLLVSGSGELLQRLDELQEEILAEPGLSASPDQTKVDSSRDAARYLAISLLLRSERAISGGIRTGYELTTGTVRWSFRALDRLTDNPLMRPVRRPFAKRGRSWADQLTLLIEEGKREEQKSKVLAGESVGVIVDEIVDLVAQNPELDRLVSEIVGQKSVGLATVMADNARTLTATGDDVAEYALRRLLRRTPRRALPPSPIEGKPQTMYRPEAQTEGGDRGDG
jgi:hypothetical protein